MKARVLKGYPDRITKRFYNENEIVDFDEVRIEELVSKGLVEVCKEPKAKKDKQETSD